MSVAWIIAVIGWVLSGIGVFWAFFYFFGGDAAAALHVATLFDVGLVALTGFLRHAVFAESDAKRLGWEGQKAFQLEVGFANLAFALIALLAYFGGWGVAAETVAVLGFGIYLLQVALMVAINAAREHRSPAYWLRSPVLTGLMAVLLIFFAVAGAGTAHLPPF
jgi:hypothetical protein